MARASSVPPVIGDYQYVRLLGSGGFSDVFLYDQAFPKRRVAVKVLLLEELTPESRAAFTTEANVMAQLSAHPYIVTIFQAAVTADDRPYLVMEYCSGPSLAEQYKRQPLSVTQALEMGVRLSSAIATAHAAGILHRDIKPANVLTNQFGWPALTDFGISSTVDELASTMTTTSHGAGTAATGGGTASVGMSIPWSPPEMFDDEPSPDVRSDVFSLAATLYTVLAGHTPFEIPGRSNGSVDLIGRIARGSITPMPRNDVPASLVAVLQKGMASDRNDRFATAVEFGRALQRVEVELAFPQTPLDIPNLAIERPERSDAGDEASADETRARVIPTVRAQAVAPVVPPAPSPVTEPLADSPQETVLRSRAGSAPQSAPVSTPDTHEATQLRQPSTVGASPVSSSTVDTSTVRRTPGDVGPGAHTPITKPRRRVLTLSIIGAVILVGAVIGVSAFVASTAKHPTSTASQAPGVGAAGNPPAGEDTGPAQPSKPMGVLASGGSSVTFTWIDNKPHKGDEFTWAPLSQDTAGATSTIKTPTVTVPYSGGTVCIQVSTVSTDLQQSATVNGCYPG